MTSLTTSLNADSVRSGSNLGSTPIQTNSGSRILRASVQEGESFSLIAKGDGKKSLPISAQRRIGCKEVEISRDLFRLFGFSAYRENLGKPRHHWELRARVWSYAFHKLFCVCRVAQPNEHQRQEKARLDRKRPVD